LASNDSTSSSKSLVPKEKTLKEESFFDRQLVERKEYMRTAQIKVDEVLSLANVTGVPDEHTKDRRVRIYKQAKNAMQSGTNDTHKWTADFENRQRWENPTMGWTSSGDPLSNMKLQFTEREDAIAFCDKNGWTYFVEEAKVRKPLNKSYAANFSWNKRSRIGSK